MHAVDSDQATREWFLPRPRVLSSCTWSRPGCLPNPEWRSDTWCRTAERTPGRSSWPPP